MCVHMHVHCVATQQHGSITGLRWTTTGLLGSCPLEIVLGRIMLSVSKHATCGSWGVTRTAGGRREMTQRSNGSNVLPAGGRIAACAAPVCLLMASSFVLVFNDTYVLKVCSTFFDCAIHQKGPLCSLRRQRASSHSLVLSINPTQHPLRTHLKYICSLGGCTHWPEALLFHHSPTHAVDSLKEEEETKRSSRNLTQVARRSWRPRPGPPCRRCLCR